MSCNDLISIIVPVYNAANTLEKTLKSLKEQTYENIEIVLVDDGSSDSSAEICLSFVKSDCRFIYTFQKNAGVSSARNKGLQLAKGRYLTFVDSDDWVDVDLIEELYSLQLQNDVDVSIVAMNRETAVMRKNEILELDNKNALFEVYSGHLFQGHIAAKLFDRKLFADVSFSEDIAILEDMVAVAKLINNAQKVAFKNTPLYHYVFNPASATKVKWNSKTWTCLQAAEELYNIIANNYPEEIIWGKLRACTTVMVIPKKLSGCGKLTKENYELLKSELMKYYAPEINEIANKREKMEFRFFFKGRISYIIYRKSVKNKFAVGLRNFLVKRGLL